MPPPPGERNTKHVNCPLRCPFRAQTHHMTLWGLFQRARGPGQVSKCPLRIKQRCSALQEVSAALLGAVFQPQSVNNQLMDQTTGNLPVIHPNAHKRRPRRRRTCGPSHLPCKWNSSRWSRSPAHLTSKRRSVPAATRVHAAAAEAGAAAALGMQVPAG